MSSSINQMCLYVFVCVGGEPVLMIRKSIQLKILPFQSLQWVKDGTIIIMSFHGTTKRLNWHIELISQHFGFNCLPNLAGHTISKSHLLNWCERPLKNAVSDNLMTLFLNLSPFIVDFLLRNCNNLSKTDIYSWIFLKFLIHFDQVMEPIQHLAII